MDDCLIQALDELKRWRKWAEELEYIDMSDAGGIECPSEDVIEQLEKYIDRQNINGSD